MATFNLKPCKTVGDIKLAMRDAILDGKIHNDYGEAYAFMLETGKQMGLKVVEGDSKNISCGTKRKKQN
jgi:poly(A) polymerase